MFSAVGAIGGAVGSIFGGGGGGRNPTSEDTSTNRTSLITDVLTRSIASHVMECSQSTQAVQRLVITGNRNKIVGSVNMKQATKLSTECFQDANMMTKMKDSVNNDIDEYFEENKEIIRDAWDKDASTVETIVKNNIDRLVSESSMVSLVNNINFIQELVIDGNDNEITEDVLMEQLNESVMKGVQNIVSNKDFINDFDNKLKKETHKTQTIAEEPINWSLIFIVLAIIVVVLGISYSYVQTLAAQSSAVPKGLFG